MIWLQALWSRIWPYIATVAAAFAAFFAIRQSGKAAGRQEAEHQQREVDAKAAEVARNVENETAAMDDDSVARESIDKWVRDNRQR